MGRLFRFTTEYDKVFPQDIVNSDFETGNINKWKAKGSFYGVDSWDPNSGIFKCYFWGTNPYEQSIYQTVKGLDNGSYTVKAWVKQNTGIPNACSMIVRDFGGIKQIVDIPHGDEYNEYSITVGVGNSQLVVEFSGWIKYADRRCGINKEFLNSGQKIATDLVYNPGRSSSHQIRLQYRFFHVMFYQVVQIFFAVETSIHDIRNIVTQR